MVVAVGGAIATGVVIAVLTGLGRAADRGQVGGGGGGARRVDLSDVGARRSRRSATSRRAPDDR